MQKLQSWKGLISSSTLALQHYFNFNMNFQHIWRYYISISIYIKEVDL
jgi:hypothetical protein